jgi:serine/threonine protein kinase
MYLKILRQILSALGSGLSVLHGNKIIHRDIKGDNVFITSEGKYKIGDFSISRIMEGTFENAKSLAGTPFSI